MKSKLLLLLLACTAIFWSGCSSDSTSKSRSKGADFLKKLEQQSEKEARKTEMKRKAEEQKKKKLQEEYQKKLAEMTKKWQEARKKQQATSPASGSSSNVQYVLSDKDLTYIVLQKIMIMTGSNTISVNCHNGVVKLFGEAESTTMKDKIIKALKKLPGVLKIDASDLHIKGKN